MTVQPKSSTEQAPGGESIRICRATDIFTPMVTTTSNESTTSTQEISWSTSPLERSYLHTSAPLISSVAFERSRNSQGKPNDKEDTTLDRRARHLTQRQEGP